MRLHNVTYNEGRKVDSAYHLLPKKEKEKNNEKKIIIEERVH